MVYSRNLVVVALCGVLVGVLASIGTMQYAQVIAYGGVNPNTAQTEPGIEKQAPSCINPRSIMQNLFSGLSKQRPCPTVSEQKTQDTTGMHGAPTVVEPTSEECAKTTNARRRAACNSGNGLTNETIR